MSAAELRQAAALMRSRAEAAAAAWGIASWSEGQIGYDDRQGLTYDVHSQRALVAATSSEELAGHIASWHPAVALLVADWLDATGERVDAGRDPKFGGRRNHSWRGSRQALAVARAYLGSADD